MIDKNDNIMGLELTEQTLPIIEQLAELMPGGFFIYRADDKEELLFANSAMAELMGCGSKEELRELTGNSFRGLVHPDDLDEVEKSISAQISANHSKLDYVEYRVVRKDGTVRYVDDYGHFVHTGEYGDIYIVFINDVTEKRKARELEQRQKLNEMRSDFLFNISHDIRTPMNAVMGFTALAKSHINEPQTAASFLDKVDISNHHMMTLIDDILEMSSLQHIEAVSRPERCDLNDVVKEVLSAVEITAREKKISVTADTDHTHRYVYADKARLLRLLSNIITNAVKFTGKGGAVKLTVREHERSEGSSEFEFAISDNGQGISQEFLPRLFEPFEREKTSTDSGYPGAGLGLSIAKRLAEIMGGTIRVQSVKGEGSVFTVDITLKTSDAENENKPAQQRDITAAKTTGRRILIVEDIEINRLLAETILKRAGFVTESAENGLEAVNAVRSHGEGYYDLILMDIQMPVMNGYDATRAIRSLGGSAESLPIIALSANAGDRDKSMSAECGMNAHIAKPFDRDHLINTINSYI